MTSEGILYEPRSLWSIAQFQASAAGNLQLNMDREHFYNGSRHPITLTRLAVSPVGYPYMDGAPALAPQTTSDRFDYDAWSAAVHKMQLAIEAPLRQNYANKTLPLSSLPLIPTGQPTADRPLLTSAADVRPSSAWGVCMLNFDRPMVMPKLGSLSFGVSAMINMGTGAAAAPTSGVGLNIRIAEGTPGTFFGGGGGATLRVPTILQEASPLLFTEAFVAGPLGGEGQTLSPGFPSWPYLATPYATSGGASVTPTNEFWPRTHDFTARDMDQQNATRAGSKSIVGINTHIDQMDWDDFMSPTGGSAGTVTLPMEQNCTSMGCRVRTENGGTNEWWWREGAPMSAVLDTITPAKVYRLLEPITLGPGDTLNVSAVIPQRANIDFITQATVENFFQFAVSFNGYASIEG